MSQMFPLIGVLGDAWHGMFWGFRARRYRPAQTETGAQRSQAKSPAKPRA